jgi:hypothetical protein
MKKFILLAELLFCFLAVYTRKPVYAAIAQTKYIV